MLNSAERNIVLKCKFVRSVDIILQKLFDVSNFRGLKFCILRRTVNTLSVDDDFRSHDLLGFEGMVAGRASTVTDADSGFTPCACGLDDGLTAVGAINWHLCVQVCWWPGDGSAPVAALFFPFEGLVCVRLPGARLIIQGEKG